MGVPVGASVLAVDGQHGIRSRVHPSRPEGSPAICPSAAARHRRRARPCTAVEQAIPFRLRGDSALPDGGSRHPGAAPVPRVARSAPHARRGCADAGVRLHGDYRGWHPERVAVPGHRVPVADRPGRPTSLFSAIRIRSSLPTATWPARPGSPASGRWTARTSTFPATTICTARSPSTTRIRDLSASRTADGSSWRRLRPRSVTSCRRIRRRPYPATRWRGRSARSGFCAMTRGRPRAIASHPAGARRRGGGDC